MTGLEWFLLAVFTVSAVCAVVSYWINRDDR